MSESPLHKQIGRMIIENRDEDGSIGYLSQIELQKDIESLLAAQPKPDIQWPEKQATSGDNPNIWRGDGVSDAFLAGKNAGIDACIEAFNQWRES